MSFLTDHLFNMSGKVSEGDYAAKSHELACLARSFVGSKLSAKPTDTKSN